MKKHGLWRFHRFQREHRESRSDAARWWVEDEEFLARRAYEFHVCISSFDRISNARAVISCANRFARRFKCIKRVSQWNALVKKIMRRSGMNHPSTERAVTLDWCREHDQIIIWRYVDSPQVLPCTRAHPIELARRIERIRSLERDRAWKQRRRALLQAEEAAAAVAAINKAIKSAKDAMKDMV